jgi:hypothetical protein
MNTLANKVPSMKEEEILSVPVIESLLVSDECCRDRVEELLLDFSSRSENEAIFLSCRCRVPVPEGTVVERGENILPSSEADNAL